ncbi:MAG: hypothetical protein AAGF11_07300 [Myxococcota bacterium]
MSRQLSIARSLVAAWLGPVVAISLLSAPVSAWAKPAKGVEGDGAASVPTPSDEDRQKAQKLRTDAQRRFAAQDYEGAIEAFEGAHALAPDPTDLFNIGRVYEEQGDLARALTYYERFSREPRLELGERQAAAERIEVLRVLVEPPSSPPAHKSVSDPGPGPTRRSDSAIDSPAAPPTDDRSRRAVSPLVVGGSALLGAGAAVAIAGGVGFGVSARRVGETIDSLDEGSNPDRLSLAQAEDQHARGQNLEALQITFIVTGAAVAAAGAGLLTAGLLKQRRARLQALAPTLSPSMVALHAAWRF